jgi:hypothetical protein
MCHYRLNDDPVLRRIRWMLVLFMIGLVVSGLTAFPLLREMEWLTSVRGIDQTGDLNSLGSLDRWILTVRDGLRDSYAKYPWLAYGTDWLAFAHIIIAIFFIGPLKEPVRNLWVIKAGIIACILVVPLALICGAIREIPLGWRLLDCSFGVIGVIPLMYCARQARLLQNMNNER